MALGIVGITNGIGRAPFGSDVAERVVRTVDGITVGIGCGDAVAEHVVGVGFGDHFFAVRVGVCGEEVAVGRVGEGLKRRERRFPELRNDGPLAVARCSERGRTGDYCNNTVPVHFFPLLFSLKPLCVQLLNLSAETVNQSPTNSPSRDLFHDFDSLPASRSLIDL